MPVRRRKMIRTANLLERLFGEERRRLKVIPSAWGEKPVLKLMSAAMTRASEKRRPIGETGFELRQLEQVRKELDGDNEMANGPLNSPETEARPSKIPSSFRT